MSSASATIVAIATPPGRSALAVVRLSGDASHAIGRRLLEPFPDSARHATLSRASSRDGSLLDECVAIRYDAPASYTGEDALELTCHGGAIAPAIVVAECIALGARLAEPGEFTRRAVLNGKLDLLQAEAVADVIDAAARSTHRIALAQLDGGLSRRVSDLREAVLRLEALAAYDIDFPEEDDGPVAPAKILETADAVIEDMEMLHGTFELGEIVRSGAVVVIAGAPNVGKSSLFNALLGRRRAIVTDVPGTTRDALEALIEAEGWPLRLVDTAGIRETTEIVERIGIQVSEQYVKDASVVLACGDSDASLAIANAAVAALTDAPIISVRTKSDLAGAATDGAIGVSAESGVGLGNLLRAIASCLETRAGALELDAPLITRARHRAALQTAVAEVRQFRESYAAASAPAVVAAVHLREATRALEDLIGIVDVEDVLDRVFSSFCVGK